MPQITLRVDERLADDVKAYASKAGRSVNAWVVSILRAAVDPDLADSETERTRARLARAGLLVVPRARAGLEAPGARRLARARRAAGTGTRLSDLVAAGRR